MTVSKDFICVIVVLVLEGLLGLWLLYRSGMLKSRLAWVVSVLLLTLALGYSSFGDASLLRRDTFTFGIAVGSCERWFVKRKYN